MSINRAARLFVQTLAWFLLLGGAAHAGPLVAAIGAFGAFLGSGTIFATIVNFAVGLAIKLGVSLLTRANKDDTQAGIKGQVQVGGTNPVSFIMGYRATAGQLEYINTWGKDGKTPNAYLTQVISLSDIPVTELFPHIYVNGEQCNIDFSVTDDPNGFPVTEYIKDDKRYLWVKFHDGTQTVVDSFLLEKFAGDPDRPWQSTMVGRGIAYAVVTSLLERSLFTGVPSMRFEVRGIKLYNPAKDSTNGGSGACRWNDQSTWEYEENNATIIYNIVRGIYYNGQWLYGGQNLPQTLLPSASWIAGVNECNSAIALAGGGTEPQYRSGYEISVDSEPLTMVEKFLDGCSGRMAEIGGFYKIHVGAPSPSVYSFTDADILATEELEFDPFPGLEATYNGANARYPEPLEAWELKDAPPYYVADYETADEGRRLIASLALDTTFSNTQVQRLMKAAVEANRRFRRHVVALPPEAWMLEPAIDTIDWTSAREGYAAKDFIITGISGKKGMIQFLQILEIDPADYDWTPALDQKPYTINYLGSVRPGPQTMPGWQAYAATLVDNTGNERRPSIGVQYAGDLDDVQSARVQVRLAGSLANMFDGTIPYGEPLPDGDVKSVVLNGTFLPATDYEVRGILVPFSGRDVEWSGWLPVTTEDIRLGDGDFWPISLGQLAQDVQDFQAWTANSVRDVLEELRAVAADGAANSLVGYSDKQELRRELQSTTGNITASYTEAIIVATGPTSGLALQIIALNATVNDPVTGLVATADAVSTLSTRVDTTEEGIETNSQAIIAVEASIDDAFAEGTFKVEVGYTPAAGWSSRIGLQARVSTASVYRDAGMFIDVTEAASRIVFKTDQFVITDGSVNAQPFVFTGGTAYLQNARIGTVYFDQLSSNNGKLLLRGSGSFADISIFV